MRKVLVVDDSTIYNSILQVFFTTNYKDIRLDYAKTGQEALGYLKSVGYPDLILLDYHMPELDGLGFLQKVGQRFTERVPVVIMTSENEESEVQRCIDAGARTSLRKPFRFEELTRVLGEVWPGLTAGKG